MKYFHLVLLFLFFAPIAKLIPSESAAGSAVTPHALQDANANPSNSKIVCVKDFELEVVRRGMDKSSATGTGSDPASSEPGGTASNAQRGPSGSSTSNSSAKSANSPAIAQPADSRTDNSAAIRANALVNVMSENLVKALEKAGYAARRQRAGEAAPQAGLRIRGVFAEPDEQNRIRRLVVGGDSTTPKMLLYVGVDDLTRPEQPLYEVAKPPSNDARHGPVITVTSFSPVVRFELNKNLSDDDLKKIAGDIVADLNELLRANPTVASQ
jgi:hypothetical protein